MDLSAINTFNILQEMRQNDIEVYHYRDSAPCGVTLHSHDFYELYFLLDGEMDYLVSGCRYTLSRGTILLIAPGELHRPDIQTPPQDYDRIVLWMNAGFVRSVYGMFSQVMNAFDGSQPVIHRLLPDEKTYQIILSLLHTLLYEKERADLDSPFLGHLILMQLLIYISRAFCHRPVLPGKTSVRYLEIMKVYEYINQNFREKITVNELAERFYMDRNTLTRQFRRIIGLTPGEYIRRKRLETAYELIRQGTGVLHAGYMSGFAEYSVFYRAFRQVYGISPGQLTVGSQKE